MLEEYPPTALELLKIQGLGPKSIRTLFEHLPRFDHRRPGEDLPGAETARTAAHGSEARGESPAVDRGVPAARGAIPAELRLRRGRRAGRVSEGDSRASRRSRRRAACAAARRPSGDLDLLVTGPGAEAALEKFAAHPKVHEVLGKGPEQGQRQVRSGRACRWICGRCPRKATARRCNISPGARSTASRCGARAQKMGLTLSEYGLSRVDTKEIVARETEEADLRGAGPATGSRRSCARIRARSKRPKRARCRSWSSSATFAAICTCTRRETDGRATLEEMAEAARERGLRVHRDHGSLQGPGDGQRPGRETRGGVRASGSRDGSDSDLGIRVFSGLECDIRRDGSMDLEDDALAELDFVIGSVHSYMNLEAAEMTDRLLRALECPHLRALGHPTGRILLHRDAYPVRFRGGGGGGGAAQRVSRNQRQSGAPGSDGVAGARGESARAASSSSPPTRIIPSIWPTCATACCMARRGWLEAGDILNTLPAEAIRRGDYKRK